MSEEFGDTLEWLANFFASVVISIFVGVLTGAGTMFLIVMTGDYTTNALIVMPLAVASLFAAMYHNTLQENYAMSKILEPYDIELVEREEESQ